MELRKYQKEIIDKVLSSDTSKDLVQLATGGGKTIVAGFLCKYYVDNNKTVLYLAHREELLNQPIEKFYSQFGLPTSIIQGSKKSNLELPVQIASVQTYHKRLNFDPDVIIIDEAHHSEASTYQKIIKYYPDAKLIGLTATPYRISGKGFNNTFDRLITSKSIKDLEGECFLVPARCYSYPIGHDKLSRIKITGGDYNEEQLEKVMNDRVLIEDIVISYEKHANGKKMIVFASSVNHSQAICQRFKEYGIKALHIDAKSKNREQLINAFRYGDVSILCNVGIATEGVDIPEIQAVCLARPTMSLALYLQMCGRGSRPFDSQNEYLLFDHSNNYYEHGAPNKDQDWSLYFNGMSKGEMIAFKKGKQFKLITEDKEEIIISNILDIPADIKGFVLEEIELDFLKNNNDKDSKSKIMGRPIKENSIGRSKYTTSIRSDLIKFIKTKAANENITPADILEKILIAYFEK